VFSLRFQFLVRDGLYTHSCLSGFCLVSPIFLQCDWSMRISLVILLASHWTEYGYSQTTHGFVQSKSPEGLYMYKCTKAGINSHTSVPSKVCAPWFLIVLNLYCSQAGPGFILLVYRDSTTTVQLFRDINGPSKVCAPQIATKSP
jgi:hypothetical protein